MRPNQTDSTQELQQWAHSALERIFKQGFKYREGWRVFERSGACQRADDEDVRAGAGGL